MSSKKKTNINSHLVNLDDYRIIKEINRGGFGIIYLIEHKKDSRLLAAKVNFRPDKSTSNETKFLSREIGILMRVEAPTIIRFFGFSIKDFQGNSNVTILMEYYQNGSLRQLIEQESQSRSPNEYDNTAKQIILCGIAHGMMTLHSRRVLHRDLKPDNVLLDINFRPRITDFGLSKFVDPSNSKSQSMSGCGTAAYMSPEVIVNTHYSTKSDVYSFGILMFEVLTGDFAFSEVYQKKNFNPFQITHQVANGERPAFKVPIKPSFKKLIERCWSKDPKERPTFRELFHKLSLSLEEDDETIESSLQDMICGEKATDEERDEFEYLLDDVDVDQLFDYVDEITSERTKKEEELQRLVEEQTKRIQLLEEQHQREINELKQESQKQIDKLTIENNRSQQEINELKIENQKQIDKLTAENSRNRQEINQLKSENQNEIDFLKFQLNELIAEFIRTFPKPEAHPMETESFNSFEELTIYDMREKIKQEKLTQFAIPSYVESILEEAFYQCTSLTQITIPSSVTSIEDSAFYKCISLTQITIPSSVTSIGYGAFSYCRSLAQITIPSSVTSIGSNAFSGCSSLTQIAIPASVLSIGHNPFVDCTNLETITVDSKNPNYVSLDDVLFTKDIQTLICYACKNKQITYTIPSSVTSIGEEAFYQCSSLTKITIPPSVTSIGYNSFYKCISLTQIAIPSSVTSMEYNPFTCCSNLETITVDSKNPNFVSIDDALFTKDIQTLILYPCKNKRTKYTIPSSITTIGEDVFYQCSSLVQITIPASVTSIEANPFTGCSSLETINVDSKNPNYVAIDDVLFTKDIRTLICYACKNKRTTYTIPSSVTSIGYNAFYKCISLTQITIPSSVKSMKYNPFTGCSSLETITVDSKNPCYVAIDDALIAKDIQTLICYAGKNKRTKYTIPSSVTTIGCNAFFNCSSLTQITIPSSVTLIESQAFSECSSLTQITIPSSVTSIDDNAFSHCSKLDSALRDLMVKRFGKTIFGFS